MDVKNARLTVLQMAIVLFLVLNVSTAILTLKVLGHDTVDIHHPKQGLPRVGRDGQSLAGWLESYSDPYTYKLRVGWLGGPWLKPLQGVVYVKLVLAGYGAVATVLALSIACVESSGMRSLIRNALLPYVVWLCLAIVYLTVTNISVLILLWPRKFRVQDIQTKLVIMHFVELTQIPLQLIALKEVLSYRRRLVSTYQRLYAKFEDGLPKGRDESVEEVSYRVDYVLENENAIVAITMENLQQGSQAETSFTIVEIHRAMSNESNREESVNDTEEMPISEENDNETGEISIVEENYNETGEISIVEENDNETGDI